MRYQALRDFYNIYFFGGILLKCIKEGDRVLELGCGSNSLIIKSGLNRIAKITAVDIYRPYIEAHKMAGDYYNYRCADILELDYKQNTFDVVVCMDVLEHIDKDKVLNSRLLSNMIFWGKQVIITTPNGYAGNDTSDGNTHQEHLSSWDAQTFRTRGYKVRGLSGWSKLRTDGAELRYCSPYLLWAGISLLSEVIVYHMPEKAYHLLATYKKGEIR